MEKKNEASAKDDVVTVVRPDGKEFLIKRNVLAEHINRGFDVKHKADMPSEEELKKAVGYKAPEAREAGDRAKEAKEAAAENTAEGEPEEGPAEEATVPEEKGKGRKRAAKRN